MPERITYSEGLITAHAIRLLRQWNRTPHDGHATGWDLFNETEIQADDEAGVFETDREALFHVALRAAAGDDDAILALAIHVIGRVENNEVGDR